VDYLHRIWSDVFGGSAWIAGTGPQAVVAIVTFLVSISLVVIQLCREATTTEADQAERVSSWTTARRTSPSSASERKGEVARKRYWVVPDGNHWAVKYEGQVLSRHDLKTDAVAAGQNVAKANMPSQLTVLKKDGTIEYEYTYGDDPYPPPG